MISLSDLGISNDLILSVVAAIFGCGWIKQILINRKDIKMRHGDELANLHANMQAEMLRAQQHMEQLLREQIGQQNERMAAMEEKMVRAEEKANRLERAIYSLKLSYAVFRQKVRVLIAHFEVGDPAWKTLADDIRDDSHDVDDVFSDE